MKRILTSLTAILLLGACQQFPQRTLNFQSVHDPEFSPTIYLYDEGTKLEPAERFGRELDATRYSQGMQRQVNVPDGTKVMLSMSDDTRVHADEVLDALKPKDVQHLKLCGTPVTDMDMPRIAKLTGLEILNLSSRDPIAFTDGQNFVTDDGVKALVRLPGLISLDLSSTYITDAALAYLEKIPTLQHLVLLDTVVTPGAVEAFKKAVPACKVTYEPSKDVRRRGMMLVVVALSHLLGKPLDEKTLAEWEWDETALTLMEAKLKTLPQIADSIEEITPDPSPKQGERVVAFPRTSYLARIPVYGYDPRTLQRRQVGRAFGAVLLPSGLDCALLNLDDLGTPEMAKELLSKLKPKDLNRLAWHSATNDDLKALTPLVGLHILDLAGSGVTDEGLVNIAALPDLQALDLGGTAITAEGIKANLSKMTSLQHLDLRGVILSRAEQAEVRQALPKCQVYADQARD